MGSDDSSSQEEEQANAQAAAANQPPNENRDVIKTLLSSLGFQQKFIAKALRVYEKSYGTEHYSQDELIQIILRMQDKEDKKNKMKKQKAQMLEMNLNPKLAEEIFGKKYKKSKKKGGKSSGY